MQQQTQAQQADRWNSVEATQWRDAQERKTFGKSERRYGVFESLSAVENMRALLKRRYLKRPAPYDFAAIAVLDEVVEMLASMEAQRTAEYDYEQWVLMEEVERVSTRVLPVEKR